MNTIPIIIPLWLLLFLAIGQLAAQASVRVKGMISYDVLDNGASNSSQHFLFTSVASTNRWSITTIAIDKNRAPIDPVSPAATISYDGISISVYEQIDVSKIPGLPNNLQNGKVPIVTNRMVVLKHSLPNMDGRFFSAAVWLPYLSNEGVKWRSISKIQRLFSMRPISDDRAECRVDAKFTNEDSAFPDTIDFYSVGVIHQISNGKQVERRLPKSLADHFSEALYRVQSVTNIGDKKYPLVSTLEYFGIDHGIKSSPRPIVIGRIVTKAESIEITDIEPFLPTLRLAGKTHVINDRLGEVLGKRVSYVTTNQTLARDEKESQKVLTEFSRREQEGKKFFDAKQRNASDGRWIVGSIFFVLTLGAFVAIVRNRNKQNKNRTK